MSGGWVVPYEYSIEKKEELLAILRPHLLEEYKDQEERIIKRIQSSVWMIAEPQETDEAGGSFSMKKLEQLEAAYNKYEKLLATIDRDSLEDIEFELLKDSRYRLAAKNFGYGEVPSITRILDDCLRRNDLLLYLLSLRERINKKHRPQDVNMRRAVSLLYTAYHDFTGKDVAVGGILQKFMQAAISPFYKEKSLTGYIRELKRVYSNAAPD